jgi:hypothetical protein
METEVTSQDLPTHATIWTAQLKLLRQVFKAFLISIQAEHRPNFGLQSYSFLPDAQSRAVKRE